MDMLPLLNLNEVAKLPPKWIMGFSDTSSLLFSMTLACDIATVHGPNLTDFSTTPIDASVLNALTLLDGRNESEQFPLAYYQREWGDIEKTYQLI